MNNNNPDWKKYLFSFTITLTIFVTAIIISNYLGQKKLSELRDIQDKISIDILSSETQFSLLAESSCEDVGSQTLSTELSNLEERLAYTERDRGTDDPEVQTLKKYYFLLEIKDFLLMKRISEKCNKNPISIIYFYSNENLCDDCQREGYVLTSLRENYPDVRIYSFDYDMDLSAVRTLTSMYNIQNKLPALLIKNKVYYGFKSMEDIEKILPELATMKSLRQESATTTESE